MMKRTLFAGAGFAALLTATLMAPGAALAQTADGPVAAPSAGNAVDEVVVTAQKREEKLLDVPVPVTVVTAKSLTETGLVRTRDFYIEVPGLTLQPNFYAQQTLTIRGINDGSGGPTVGIIVDGVPFGGSTSQTSGFWLPDLDPGDLSRIEVLKGPQGTLYGTNSLGGLISLVTKEPSLTQASGEVMAGVANTDQDVGYTIRGAANMPISDTLAVRGSAFFRRDPGYIDNIVYHIKDANKIDNGGLYLTLLWKPIADLSWRLSAIYQTSQAKAPSESDRIAGYGEYARVQNYLPSVHGSDNRSTVFTSHIDGEFNGIKLSSVSGYSINNTEGSIDWSYSFGPTIQKDVGVGGAPFFNHTIVQRTTQEFRASGTVFSRLDWLAGGFFSHEIVNGQISMPETNLATLQVIGNYRYGDYSSNGFTVDSLAGFFDLTYRFTDKFDVQVGGRYTGDRLARPATYTYGQYVIDYLHAAIPYIVQPAAAMDSAFTYLVTPRYKLTSDVMVYARFASGYRPGAPNGLVPNGVPTLVQPDYTSTYEAGLKGLFLDGKVSVDASLYYIDWRNLQLSFFDTSIGLGYASNGGRAKSEGLELDVGYRPWKGALFEAKGSLQDSVLTQDLPRLSAVQAKAGARLPNSAPFQGNLSYTQDLATVRSFTPFLGGAFSYVGDRLTVFTTPTQVRETYPAYGQFNLRAGVRNGDWAANLYINNVGDSRGVLSGGAVLLIPPNAYVYNTPRTIGFNVTRSF